MASNSKKILVIEDEKPLAHALELKLKKQGHSVTVALDGQSGIDLLFKDKFDVVLLDLMMPLMNGFQVLEKMQAAPHMPAVFVLSNLTQPEDEARVMMLGARKVLVKSDTPLAQLVEEIEKV
jgi:DNA-binding response OmpR family regulator